jgi:hypothetical protein
VLLVVASSSLQESVEDIKERMREEMAERCEKTAFFGAIYIQKRSFYQARLGTNIGKR